MSVPSEAECFVCEEWKPVRGWDHHIQGFFCRECHWHLMWADGELFVAKLSPPEVKKKDA